MKSIIYSIYIDIEEENLEKNNSYVGDDIPKSLRTKIELKKHYENLVKNKENYAKSCKSDYKVFGNDEKYQNFVKYFKKFNNLEFDIINFYKIYLFEELSKEYDQVLYLDLDVIIKTDENFFEKFNSDQIYAYAPDCSQQNIWRENWVRKYLIKEDTFDDVAKKYLEKQNMYVKNMAKNAMLATQLKKGSNYLLNTAILSSNSKTIKQIKFFDNITQHVKYFNDAKDDNFFGEELTKLFFINNEVFFSFVIENYNLPFYNIDEQWHYMLINKQSYNTKKFNNAKFIHVIDKNFDRVFKICGIKK